MICKVVANGQQTPLIGSYLQLSNLDRLPDLEEALDRFLGMDPGGLGYLNSYINRLSNPQEKQVTDLLEPFGILELLGSFGQRICYRHLQTWCQFHLG